MLTIDGSQGEGGGQVLRTCLALGSLTGIPFRIENIRAKREKPGLMRQHLTCAIAAARVCGAHVDGAAVGSTALTFLPGRVQGGQFTFPVGSAGSTTLVFQTILWPLLAADMPSVVHIEGGTHNPAAPPVDFLERAFLPLLRRMGARVDVRLQAWGFYPAGGGRIEVKIQPQPRLGTLALCGRGATQAPQARAIVARLPRAIAERESATVRKALDLPEEAVTLDEVPSAGPGNYLAIEVEMDGYSEVFSGFGQRGVRAETVAEGAAEAARQFLEAGVPVGPHLADQLLIPLALGAGGTFRTTAPTPHTLTNLDVIRLFLEVDAECRPVDERVWEIRVGGQAGGASATV